MPKEQLKKALAQAREEELEKAIDIIKEELGKDVDEEYMKLFGTNAVGYKILDRFKKLRK